MATILVIDGSPIAYQQFNAVGHLRTSTGEKTGLRFGFLRAIRSYAKKFDADRVVICWDVRGKVLKALDMPEYKANRVMTDEKKEMYGQFDALKELIALTGWTQVEEPGYEADDLIGFVTKRMVEKGHNVVIVSIDNDLLQLLGLGPKVQYYVPGKNARLKTEEDVILNYGVPPWALVYLRAAAGDPSDNISGVAGLKGYLVEIARRFCTMSRTEPLHEVEEKMQAWCQTDWHRLPDVFKAWKKNLDVMRLQCPPQMQILKGKGNREALGLKFKELEFHSLLGKTDEFMLGKEN